MAEDKNKKRHRINGYPFLFVILMIVALSAGIIAKYVHQTEDNNQVRAKEFYFTSDLLSEIGGEYLLNATESGIAFKVENSMDTLHYSEMDIDYEVEVEMSNGADFGTDASETITPVTGTLTGGAGNSQIIEINGLKKGIVYTVTVTGRTNTIPGFGYKKVLYATFSLAESGMGFYKHLDISNPHYVLLTIWTENLKGDVKISVPEGMIPDNTDAVLKDVDNYQDVVGYSADSDSAYKAFVFEDDETFDKTYSSRSYRFFIDDPKNIDIDKFVVEMDETLKAVESTPQ